MSTEYDYYKTGDDNVYVACFGANQAAQTFKASGSYTITKVKLLLYAAGTDHQPGTITVTINTTLTGKPTATILCSGTTNGNTLPTGSPYEWREITLGAGAALTGGTTYSIVVSAPSGNNNNRLQWRDDASSPTYTNGTCCYSSNSGSTWTADAAADQMFDTYGDPTIVYVDLETTGGFTGGGSATMVTGATVSLASTGGFTGGGSARIIRIVLADVLKNIQRLVACGNDQFWYEEVW
jgi:hypothetical protein